MTFVTQTAHTPLRHYSETDENNYWVGPAENNASSSSSPRVSVVATFYFYDWRVCERAWCSVEALATKARLQVVMELYCCCAGVLAMMNVMDQETFFGLLLREN